MNTSRKTAVTAGVLFIVATAASLVGTSFTRGVVDAPDYPAKISANANPVTLAVLFLFIAAATSAGIAISLYPILRRYNEGLALGSVGFRLIEAVFYLVAALGLLSLLSLSQEYATAGAPAASDFQIIGSLLLAARNWANFVFGVLAFCLGGLMYYWVFYQSKLVPRWLSAWGIIGALSLMGMALSILFGAQPSGTTLFLAFPIALQEMVLAVWLIVRGFDQYALAAGSAKGDGAGSR